MKSFTLSVCLALAVVPAFADDASKATKAEELLRLTNVEANLKQSLELISKQMKSGVVQQITGVKLPEDQQKRVDELQAKVEQLVYSAIEWEKLKPDFVKLYADAFTEEQLDDILTFYRSPSGQAMIGKMPELMPKAMEISQRRMAEIMPQLQQMLKDFVAETRRQLEPRPLEPQ